MPTQLDLGIKIRSEADTRAYERVEDATKELMRVNERIIRTFDNQEDELEELGKRYDEHTRRVRALASEQGKADLFARESTVRAFEREQFEQKRKEADESTWQRRRGQMQEEYDQRTQLNRAYYEARDAERREYNEDTWQRRRSQMGEEYDARQQLNRAYYEQKQLDREESFAARRAERDWQRRKEAIIDYAQAGVAAAATAVAAFAKESVEAYTRFDSLTRQVATINSDAAGGLGQFRNEARALSREMDILPDVMAQTLYQADSLGSADIFEDARLASEAAVAGYTDANIVLEAMLKTGNAFADGMYENEQILDLFFTGVDRGAFTVEDLATGISEVTSVAGETGTALEDVMAALVVMTKQGDDFNEAVSLSALLLTQLGLEGTNAFNAFKEASGQSYKEYIAAGGDLAGALELLQQHADRTGKSMGELIAGDSPFYRDQQAARAALELTGIHLEEMREETDAMTESAGMMANAYEIMAESSERDIANMQVAWEDLKLSVGEYIFSLEGIPNLMGKVSDSLEYLSGGTTDNLQTIVDSGRASIADMDALSAEAQLLVQSITAGEESESWWSQLFGTGDEVMLPLRQRTGEIVALLAEQSTSSEDFVNRMKEVFGDQLQTFEQGGEVYLEIGRDYYGAASHHYEEAAERLANGTDKLTESFVDQAMALESNAEAFGDIDAEMAMLEKRATGAAAAVEDTGRNIAEVTKILDGDTLRLDSGVDIRLNAVNTPETAKDFLGKIGMPFGDEATAFTQRFLINPEIEFEQVGTDDYGRILSSVFNGDGASLEHELVKEGLALPLPVEMTGDEQLTRELEQLARNAAAKGKGIFEDERIADAFLSGRISDMEEVMAMYEELAAADQEYYNTYLGYLTTTVSSLDDLKSKLSEAAVSKALLEGNTDSIPYILDMAVAMGTMTEEQAGLQQMYADSMIAIDEQAAVMGNAQIVTADMTETMTLLATGLFDTRENAAAAAEAMDAEMVAAFVSAQDEGETLVDVLSDIGLRISDIEREVVISFKTDLSEYLPPGEVGSQRGTAEHSAVAFSAGGRVRGGTPGVDSVPAILMPDEYVITARAARAIGYERLDALNSGNASTGSPAAGSGAAAPDAGGITVQQNFYFTSDVAGLESTVAAAAGQGARSALESMGVRRK